MKLNKLLALPFLISPLLITSIFIDVSLNIKIFSIFSLFAVILVVFYIFNLSSINIPKSSYFIYYLLSIYLSYLLITSYFISINKSESFFDIFYLFGWFLVYGISVKYFNKESFKLIIYVTSVIGTLLSFLVYNDIFQLLDFNIPSYGKLSATFGYKNFFAQYLCFVIPACISSVCLIKQKPYKLIMFLCLLINCGALLFTRSRGAWIGLLISLLIFILINKKLIKGTIVDLYKNKYILIYTITSLSLFLYLVSTPININSGIWIGDKSSFKNTIFSVKNINSSSFWGDRIDMYESSFRMFKTSPIFGIGVSNWKVLYPGYSLNKSYTNYSRNKNILRPHNDLLRILIETGVIGIMLLLMIIGYHIKILFRHIKRFKFDDQYFILMFSMISLIAIGIESLFDFPSERAIPNLYFWSILGYISNSELRNCNSLKSSSTKIIYIAMFCLYSFFIFIDNKSQLNIQKSFNSIKHFNFEELNDVSTSSLISFRNIDYLSNPVSYHIGLRYRNLGYDNIALDWFDQSLMISPYHFETLNNKMLILIKQKKVDKSYKILLEIDKYYPKLNSPKIKMVKYFIRYKELDYANKVIALLENKHDNNTNQIIDNLKNILHNGI